MVLTKSPISLHGPAGLTPWTAPGQRFMSRFRPLFPRNFFSPVRPPAFPTALTRKANS
jgi:hypothetical protein